MSQETVMLSYEGVAGCMLHWCTPFDLPVNVTDAQCCIEQQYGTYDCILCSAGMGYQLPSYQVLCHQPWQEGSQSTVQAPVEAAQTRPETPCLGDAASLLIDVAQNITEEFKKPAMSESSPCQASSPPAASFMVSEPIAAACFTPSCHKMHPGFVNVLRVGNDRPIGRLVAKDAALVKTTPSEWEGPGQSSLSCYQAVDLLDTIKETMVEIGGDKDRENSGTKSGDSSEESSPSKLLKETPHTSAEGNDYVQEIKRSTWANDEDEEWDADEFLASFNAKLGVKADPPNPPVEPSYLQEIKKSTWANDEDEDWSLDEMLAGFGANVEGVPAPVAGVVAAQIDYVEEIRQSTWANDEEEWDPDKFLADLQRENVVSQPAQADAGQKKSKKEKRAEKIAAGGLTRAQQRAKAARLSRSSIGQPSFSPEQSGTECQADGIGQEKVIVSGDPARVPQGKAKGKGNGKKKGKKGAKRR